MSVAPSWWTMRIAGAGDAEAIAVLHATSWQRTYRGMMSDEFLDHRALANRQDTWRRRLTRPTPGQFVCVAETNALIVGFICMFIDENPVWGSCIDNLHVVYDQQGRGVGRALMRSAAELLGSDQQAAQVYLWVMEANVRARRFYDQLGAVNVETVDQVTPDGGHASNCRYAWPDACVLL